MYLQKLGVRAHSANANVKSDGVAAGEQFQCLGVEMGRWGCDLVFL